MQNNTIRVLDTLRKTIAKYQMLKPGDTVLVGVSGGADSVCLLHALHSLKTEYDIKLEAAHLNHGIRGAEAERDARFVRKLCKSLHIPCHGKTVDIPALAKEMGVSQETAGRMERYRFFRELSRDGKITVIATAHNRNDQAETLLMRVMRGCGLDGLSGIRYCRADGVIRPLLDVERTEIEGYIQENKLEFVTDSTNLEDGYTRNKIRHQLLPMMEEFNPHVVGAIAGMAETLARDGDFINGYASRLYRRIQSPLPQRKPVVLDIETMGFLERSIQTRVLGYAVKDAMGKDYTLERCHLDSVLSLLDKETGASVSLPGGLRAAVRYGWLALETGEEPQPFDGNIQYEVELGRVYDLEGYQVSLTLKEMPYRQEKWEMVLDYDKVKELPLTIRTRRQGDRIAVFRDGRERKLKDFLIDQKIPASMRDRIPLLCSGDKVLAVMGVRAAEPLKPDKTTTRGLVIQYGG